jgi:hypothetical protein
MGNYVDDRNITGRIKSRSIRAMAEPELAPDRPSETWSCEKNPFMFESLPTNGFQVPVSNT